MVKPAMKESQNNVPALTVLYDGACPLCRREINVYRDLQPLQPESSICFADVSNTACALPVGATREQLLARFHVQRRNGELLSGASFSSIVVCLAWLALACLCWSSARSGLGDGMYL